MSEVQRPLSPWLDQMQVELSRGRHVLLTGNVADAYPVGRKFDDVVEAARAVLREHGCAVVGVHDIADGMSFEKPEERKWFGDLYAGRRQASDRPTTGPGSGSSPGPGTSGDARIDQGDQRFVDIARRRETRRFQRPADALAAARLAVAQCEHHVGLVFNLAELTFPGGEAPTQDELHPLALLSHVIREAAFLEADSGTWPRNTIVLVSAAPSRALAHYVAREPQIATVEVGLPTVAERRAFLAKRADVFYGAEGLDDTERTRHAEELTRLTDGLRTWDLEALRRTSFTEKVELADSRRLASRFALGQRSSPWDETAATVFAEAYQTLSSEVMGQDAVIRAVCSRLMVARYGVGFEPIGGRRQRRPRATFFFVGPTGVGKTELAKALARLLFGDDTALITFDMTEFRDRASAARLTGSDPGFVGFEQGGQLVNAVRARPFSILLFDEIDKAHPSVLDLFIAILDEGRLTDGHGRTASFADTIVIFTSNAGVDELAQARQDGKPLEPEEVRELFVKAVRKKLTLPPDQGGIGRPEILGRLRGGVMGFDMLRPELFAGLTGKFLDNWRENVMRVYGARVTMDEDAFCALVERRLGDTVLESGARELEPHLRELLEEPLAALAAAGELRPGATVGVEIGDAEASPRFAIAVDETPVARGSR